MRFGKVICLFVAASMLFALTAFGAIAYAQDNILQSEAGAAEWSCEGYFADEDGNMLSITWMEDIDEPGWFVGFMNGEDPVADSYGGVLLQEGSTLHGKLVTEGDKNELTVTISEGSENSLLLVLEDGTTFRFAQMELEEACIFVTVSTEGWGNIAYAESGSEDEIDKEYPFQMAWINLAEPASYTITAWPQAGNSFVKWTKNGEDFSMEPQITVLLDDSADFAAVFEEDPGWQNPVMNFVGEYQCGRAHALIECFGNEDALIIIEWGENAWNLARWTIVGLLDPETLTINYSCCTKSIVTCDENGVVQYEETEYDGGTGTVAFHEDMTFTWHEDQAEKREDMTFNWLPAEND